jgi:hypothetical protein
VQRANHGLVVIGTLDPMLNPVIDMHSITHLSNRPFAQYLMSHSWLDVYGSKLAASLWAYCGSEVPKRCASWSGIATFSLNVFRSCRASGLGG